MESGKGLSGQPLHCVMCGDACETPADSNGITACDGCVQFAIESVCGIEIQMKQKPKLGRPPSPRGLGNYLPSRTFGRVSDEDWAVIREACDVSGQSLVEWGLPLLLREARKRIQKESKK